MKKWLGFKFTSGKQTCKDFMRFSREFRMHIKKLLSEYGLTLVTFKSGEYDYIGRYDFYGFAFNSTTGKYVYFSIDDVRSGEDQWYKHMHVRAAEGLTDYSGGIEKRTELDMFGETVARLAA